MRAISKTSQHNNHGTALLTTMIITSILTMSLAGYIAVVSTQNKFSARTQGWNLAVAVAEAGIEEGLQHLNANSAKLSVDGWKADGSTYTLTRVFTDGNGYSVFITNSASPSIVSRAYINNFTFAAGAKPIGQVGGDVNPAKTIVRSVIVTCTKEKSSLFTRSLAVQSSIDMNGNNILTDSYDSSDMFASSNGMYSAALAGSEGDIACNGTLKNAIDIGNANIYGHLSTGPGVPIKIGKNGGIGSKEWQKANGGSGIQDGWVKDDSNFTFPDTTLPYKSGLPLKGGNVVTTSSSITAVPTKSLTYPTPFPSGGIVTNTGSTTTSFYPSPVPKGLTTNTSFVTSPTQPAPILAKTTTNSVSTTAATLPAAGTYLGAVTTNSKTTGKTTTYTYTYNAITSYTYPVYSYTYPYDTYVYSLSTTNTIYTTNYYDNILYSGDYYANALKGYTLILGKARLVLTSFEMESKDSISIGSGCNIQLYVDAESCHIEGKGVANSAGKPADFILYGTPKLKEFEIQGNGTFVGVLIAPNAFLKLSGGGKDNQDFCGAAMVNSLQINGKFNFHYDKALKAIDTSSASGGGGSGRYLITSWNEAH